MWKIIKTELEYSSRSLLLASILMLGYTFAIIFHLPLLDEQDDFSKVFWPIISGIGPIFIIAKFLILRMKDGRNRLFISLPIKTRDVGKSERIFGMVLAIAVLLYFVVMHMIIIRDMDPITKRLIYNIGIYIIIFSTAKVAFEMMLTIRFKDSRSFILAAAVFVFFVMLCIFISDTILFPILHQSYIGIIYSIVGLGIYYAGTEMYNNRHDFTK